MIFQIRQTIDIKKDNPVLEYKQGLDYGNNLAHEWLVFVEEDGALVDLSSVAVTGYFLREDGVTVKVDGSVKNGACAVVFDRRCYLIEGAVKCAMVLTRGAEVVTSAKLRTNANQSITDQIIDTGDTIPTDIYDLLTQIDAMREATTATVAATAAANTAAQRANAGAERAEQLQIDASGLAGDSNKLGGKPPEAYSAVNLLVNPDFAIAQAGYNGMHGNEYFCADRWNGSNNEIKLSKNVGYITLTSTADYRQIYQKVLVSDLVSDEYTFAITRRSASVASSLYLYGENANGNVTAIKSVSMSRGDEWQTFVLNFTRAEVAQYTKIWCCIRNQATGAVDYKEPGLYPGTYTAETMPPYVPKGYTVELVECKRYYRRSWIGDISSVGVVGFVRNSYDTSMPIVNWEEPMRTNPTVTLYSWVGGAGCIRNWSTSTDVTKDVISAYATSPTGFSINGLTNITAGYTYAFHYEAIADL